MPSSRLNKIIAILYLYAGLPKYQIEKLQHVQILLHAYTDFHPEVWPHHSSAERTPLATRYWNNLFQNFTVKGY